MADRRTSRRRVDAQVWVAAYRPLGVSPEAWVEVRPFVLDVVERALAAGVAPTPILPRTVTRLAVWCVGERIALDREVALDPETVEHYSHSLGSSRSRGTYRALLRRIGPLVTRNAPWPPPSPALSARRAAAPYTAAELAGLRRDADHQRTAAAAGRPRR